MTEEGGADAAANAGAAEAGVGDGDACNYVDVYTDEGIAVA